MISDQLTLGGLFLSAFLASTILPGGSEVVLAALSSQEHYSPWVLFAVATAGNTLGGMSTWGIGFLMSWRFPPNTLSNPRHQTALIRLKRWGSPALLLSWVPIIGDPLCLVAGWLRINGWKALGYIGLSKAARYAVIVAVVA